jgi:S-formylglutathione hydrolase FrmB
MGGEGTFLYALHHPEMFSSACPLSAATGPMTPADTRAFLLRFSQPPPVTPPDSLALDAYFKAQSVLYMVENMPESQKKAVRWYIDCGDQDSHIEANCAVASAMYRGGIPREFRVRSGAHNWTYWRDSLPEVLKFVSDAFHQY